MVMRLAFAVVLAMVVHGVLLAAKIPWVTPKMMTPQSREVTISLVNVTRSKPVPEVIPAAPKPKPPPKTIRRPKPKAKPTAKVHKPEPPPAPVPAPVEKTAAPPQTVDPPPVQDDHPPSEPFEDAALPPPPTEETGAVVEVSVPLYDINPSPNYPNVAIRRRYEGTVMLDVLVDKTGRAAEVKVARSSGYAVLDRSAKADVSGWRFKPARRGMQTVEMWIQVPVRYELKK
jgi:protein TonB